MMDKLNLKNRIRQLRKEKNLSQEELAMQVGTTRQTIIAIEKGTFNPSVKLAILLCMALDVDFEHLFYFE
ncbi:MAG: helix-turn-helix transcriptional regulator [Clostridia bacterium]|nr:helix-turn-helix transcriptional regulator [Clostridia bacterium]MBQ8792404.1 helix-turn-helix transcriptional regulator [Clostridia bacterium]